MLLNFHRFPLSRLVSGAMLSALVLSGCQTLSLVPEPKSLTVVTVKADDVERHQFALAEDQALIGRLAQVDTEDDDTLSDLARHFGLGFNDITIANPQLDPWALDDQQTVLLPLQFILPEAPRNGIVLNLANMRLFYYPKNQNSVQTYPVGIGRDGWNTPLGATRIVAKKAHPAWTVPESIQREHQALGEPLPKVVPSGPENPLGDYAMPLGFNGYLIHGTNKPYGIGMQVSHGCVQLYPEDVEVLFEQVDVGTPVRIVHQPYLAALNQNGLYLEAHRPLEKWLKQEKSLQKSVKERLAALATDKGIDVDWLEVDRVLARADGVPTPVMQGGPDRMQWRGDALQVAHPARLFGQPVPAELTAQDWSLLFPDLDNELEAEKLAAMLNHLGPQIPARKVEKDGVFQVVAGPFKSKKETKVIAKRIKSSFDLEVTPVKPSSMTN